MSNILLKTLFGNKLKKIYTLAEAFEIFNEMDLISHGELAEKAISKKSGIAQCRKNTPGIDLESGKQIKYAQTNYETQAYCGTLKGYITIKNHDQTILAVVTETLTKKQYFFHFPYSSYSHYSANTFCIPFEIDGTPRRSNDRWKYAVDSWEDLCKLAK